MLRTKAIKKMFTTTLFLFIILFVFTISSVVDNTLSVNVVLEEVGNITTDSIYLLNKNNYLIKKNILLDFDNNKDKVYKAISYMTEHKENKFSSELIPLIPMGTRVNDVICGEDLVTIDFSKELLDVSVTYEKHMISSIVYTVIGICDVSGVSILVDGEVLNKYPNTGEKLDNILNKDIGINNNYDITDRSGVAKVVIYYLDDIDNDFYYVPVTKYVNDERDKIKIIIEELSTSYIYDDNLISFVNSRVELLDYYIKDDIFFLNFNEYLFDSNDVLLEEVLYCIGYSVFDNYDINMVMFEVNGEVASYIYRDDFI